MRRRWRRVAIGLAVVMAAGWLASASRTQVTSRTVQERLGYPKSARLLILHADNLGMSHSVNRATFEALEKGWVTSSSILVPCPWFPDVVRFAKTHPDADLGIHLALNSEWTGVRWAPVVGASQVPSLVDADGYLPLLETTVGERANAVEAERELRAQIERARSAGIHLSHFDSHMGALFQNAALIDVYRRLGAAFDMPLLFEKGSGVEDSPSPWTRGAQQDALIDRVVSINPGVAPSDWQSAYERLLTPLSAGVYELIVHLAYDDEEMRGATWDHPDWGAAWRQSDLELVRSAAFREFLRAQGFVLTNWRALGRARNASGR